MAFVRREVGVRYKEAYVGVAWAVLQPLRRRLGGPAAARLHGDLHPAFLSHEQGTRQRPPDGICRPGAVDLRLDRHGTGQPVRPRPAQRREQDLLPRGVAAGFDRSGAWTPSSQSPSSPMGWSGPPAPDDDALALIMRSPAAAIGSGCSGAGGRRFRDPARHPVTLSCCSWPARSATSSAPSGRAAWLVHAQPLRGL